MKRKKFMKYLLEVYIYLDVYEIWNTLNAGIQIRNDLKVLWNNVQKLANSKTVVILIRHSYNWKKLTYLISKVWRNCHFPNR